MGVSTLEKHTLGEILEKEDTNMSASRTIRSLRTSRKLTQTQFGKLVGVPQTTVSSWEKGTREPSKGNIRRIAKEFNIDPRKLI